MNNEDVILWPDDTWCYRYELTEMRHKSDDFQVFLEDSPEWTTFLEREA